MQTGDSLKLKRRADVTGLIKFAVSVRILEGLTEMCSFVGDSCSFCTSLCGVFDSPSVSDDGLSQARKSG